MFKKTLLLLIAMMMCLSAGARTVIRSHEDFVHMPDYQKDQHVIKLMEMMVELEGKYKRETKKYGYSKERFEKFQKAVEIITSQFLISSAYARNNPQKPWKDVAADFVSVLRSNSERCIFAGWVSRMGVKSGAPANSETVCKHPELLGANDPEKKAYPSDPGSTCGKNGKAEIQCNPVVFGYQKVNKASNTGTLFCVSTDNSAENSSYECMKAALGKIEVSGEKDSAEVRLGYLREQLVANPSAFDGVQKFVYKTCVCPTTPLENFSPKYHSYMRPHQTCYGLMNMVSETVNCQDPKLPLDDAAIFTNLRDFLRNKTPNSGMDAAAHYRDFLNNEVIKTSRTTYNNLCGTNIPDTEPKDQPDQNPEVQPQTPKYVCKQVLCDPKQATPATAGVAADATAGTAAAPAYTCTYEATEEGKTELATWSKIPTELPSKPEDTKITISGEIGGKPVSLPDCPLTVNQAQESDEEDKPEKTFTVKIDKEEEKTVIVKATIIKKGDESKTEIGLDGSTWVWRIKDAPEGTKEGWKEEQKPEDNSPGGDTPDDNQESEGSEGSTPTTPPAKLEITQPRLSKKYQVCGKLDALEEQCVEIKPIAEKPAAAPTTTPTNTAGGATVPGAGMPQAPIRGAADTSAIGIR